ncbi:alpha-ketoacid dehydrogenase subunit beta [Parasulfuritortus cantonensis]|uniref:Alpha-ketoacid dehydrogenase subunit beta n=1 Tax=Parasulfuritortus cantonensis TaxID=2528202 RepID=A0A4R1BDB8_9PROT|nr:transketolase C-terminal domain-containing protein [Parasulfuritortus cantonensis]TCJ14978.1 alpha-ketoacid dehydrogenase subunit beta [Parasulfuritortus cantonensis]
MSTMTLEQAVQLALREEMGRDASVLYMGEGVATKHADMVADFGADRVRNTPLAEAIIAGTAVGAAASGLRPVIDLLFAPFMTYAMDALVNSAGKLRYLSGGQFSFPLVALGMTGAGWGVGGQHNHNLEAMFVHAPGLKVVMPATPADARGLLKAAIRDANPVLFFLDIGLLHQPGPVPDAVDQVLPLGEAAVPRSGRDVTLVSYGKTVAVCLEAAAGLQADGIDAEVVDLRTLKPLDEAAVLRSLAKTGRLVVVQEASGLCGVAAEIAALAAGRGFPFLQAPVARLTGPDAPAPGNWALEQAMVPSAQRVMEQVRALVGTPALAA